MSGIGQIVPAYPGGLDSSVILRWPTGTSRCDFATFEADQICNQADGTGFVRLNALRLRIRALAGARGQAKG